MTSQIILLWVRGLSFHTFLIAIIHVVCICSIYLLFKFHNSHPYSSMRYVWWTLTNVPLSHASQSYNMALVFAINVHGCSLVTTRPNYVCSSNMSAVIWQCWGYALHILLCVCNYSAHRWSSGWWFDADRLLSGSMQRSTSVRHIACSRLTCGKMHDL